MKNIAITLAAAAGTAAAASVQSAYGQCGGQGWTGATSCVSGYSCVSQNPYYAQCTPGTAPATSAAAAVVATKATTTAAVSKSTSTAAATKAATTSASRTSAVAVASTSAAAAAASGRVKYAGVNISGFDFGCGTDGTCTVSGVTNPGTNGANQMTHFVTKDGLNAFRLPVAWQYLVNDVLGGTATNLAAYDTLVQACLSAGAAMCIVDLHNYARWNGEIIGQSGGPTNAQFASIWTQIATKYASSPKVAFGIMNEPHDLPSVTTWAASVQAAVTAIRNAGATQNIILLPGNDYTHASTSISDGSYAALKTVKNPAGTTTNLIFDVHQYLDSDGSGTHSNCVTNNIAAFSTLATQLRADGRQAMLTETGGGSTDPTCLSALCEELVYLDQNSDVYIGYTGWGAGAFATSYVLSEVPTGTYPNFVDQELVSQCIVGAFTNKTLSFENSAAF